MNTKTFGNLANTVVCGIIGGVGPMAGVKLHEKIISATDTDGTDQDHLSVHHISASSKIVDRTTFLLDKSSVQTMENPANGAFQAFCSVYQSVQKDTKKLIVGVPCNTFHAPLIWSNFTDQVKHFIEEQDGIDVHVINMIDATVDYIIESTKTESGPIRVGLMSTQGTRSTKVYHQKLEDCDIKTVCIPDHLQIELDKAIFDSSFGIKAHSSPVSKTATEICKYCADWLIQVAGVDIVILGCTELPLAISSGKYSCGARSQVYQANTEGSEALLKRTKAVLIDPVEILAKNIVLYSGKKHVSA